jgi:hypothetical protein
LHGKGTEVEVAVCEAHILFGVGALVDHEGQRSAARENLDALRLDFDFARGHRGVDHRVGARAYSAADGKTIFHLEVSSDIQKLARRIGVDDDLRDAIAVANIDEGDSAMIAFAMHPAIENH